MPADAVAGGDNADSPDSRTSPIPIPVPIPIPSSRVPRVELTEHIRHILSQKRANFDFPPSLVFVAPPTGDSTLYQSRASNQLLVPNSYRPLSLVDNDSAAVISYEYFLVEHLDALNAIPLQEGHASVLEVENLRNEILDTLQRLDRSKGDEWNKQLHAQLHPSTFVISGKDPLSLSCQQTNS